MPEQMKGKMRVRRQVGASNPGMGKQFGPVNHRKAMCGVWSTVHLG